MKIAIVGPSPVPFTIGGVENALFGMQEYINKHTPHACDLIKIPVREDSFWGLIDAYQSFAELNLDHFDAVISTKYPAWMVRHPNHVCYMFHCLRGFYDTYRFLNLPEEVDAGQDPHVRAVCTFMEDTWETPDAQRLFAHLEHVRENRHSIPAELLSFPHPFIRRIVRYLDRSALLKISPHAFFSLSETVKKRTDYFPGGVNPKVLYLPSHQQGFRSDTYQYFFTVSRLDSAKRIDLIVSAMKHVDADIPLIIAGRGPEEAKLKDLAAGDARIRFVGFVNDDELKTYYANALAVVFTPYDEDYGLITIEAMMSRKPVVTCADSGGTTEFVEPGVTGYIAEPNPRSIGHMMDLIARDPESAVRMGEAAWQRVSAITWQSTVQPLLEAMMITMNEQSAEPLQDKTRRKVTVTSNFAVFPPKGGGQSRIYNLYKHLAEHVQVEIVSMAGNDLRKSRREIAPGLIEQVIPKTIRQAEKEWAYESQVGCPVSDSALPFVSYLTPEYGDALKKSIQESDLVIASHPYLYHEIEKYRSGKPLIYEAQDVEYKLKSSVYKNNNKQTKELLGKIQEIERKCCSEASLILTCSEEDVETLIGLYDISRDKFMVVANGVDCGDIPFLSEEARKREKDRLGLGSAKIALFVGSWHQPNIEAAKFILKQARTMPDVQFIIAGSVCSAIDKLKIPPNVGLFGSFSEGEKKLLYKTVDIALNPMFTGSGTNLKMFDYMAAGIPVVSSVYGTRGIQDTDAIRLFENPDDFPVRIRELIDHPLSTDVLMAARKMVEAHYDWKVIADKLTDGVNSLLP